MSFVLRCQELSASNPDALAFTHLSDGGQREYSLTRGELELRARAVAQELLARGLSGRRVLLLYVPGLDFVVALLGCLYAGAVAVPAYPPEPGRLQRTLPRLQAIVSDCSPALVLTTTELLNLAPFVFNLAPDLAALTWAASETWCAHPRSDMTLPTPRQEDLAFLQYTSGSTAVPKGVMIGHDSLIAQLELNQSYLKFERSVVVSWLPFYHDLGLIGSILLPLWSDMRSVLMSPLEFLKRPLLWLQAIDKYRADLSPAPPFALDLCVRKLRAGELHGLDLSCLRSVPVGAEPIHRATLERFIELLRPCGFRPESLIPGYGLAEAVLSVSASRAGEPFLCRSFSAAALREGRVLPVPPSSRDATELVSAGLALKNQRIEIVDPKTLRCCAQDRVGEIWLTGRNIARGYWNRSAESAQTFEARLADSGEGPFLRTGDLGFLLEGQLYIVGRIKDLIIIRGQNHHPSDLEKTMLASHPLLRPGGCAAFSIDEGAGEQLVVAAEVSTRELPDGELRHHALREISQAMRRAVSEQHELAIHTVILLEPGQLPKTSSGKIMRQPTREDFLAGRLVEIARFTLEQEAEQTAAADGAATTAAAPSMRSPDELVAGLSTWLAERLRIPADDITPERSFIGLGLDSKEAVAIAGELSTLFNLALPATALYDYPSIEALARHLASAGVPPQPSPEVARQDSKLAAGSQPPATPGCAVLLAGGGSGRPLFLVPGLYGVLSAFSQLARELAAQLPIWGLDLPVHRGLQSPASLTALAQSYADELCAMPEAAPYRILGYCSGGMLGLEIARQLVQRGRAVEKLVLLDAPCLDAQRTELAQLRKESSLEGERHAQLTLEQAVRLSVHYILGKQWAFGEGADLAEQMVRGGTANLTLFQGYEPRPLDIAATLISARERVRFPLYEQDAARNARRWSELLARPLTQLEATGDHHSMLQPPHVAELAQQLLGELARAESGERG